MMALIKFRVEEPLKHLMRDKEFRRHVIRAYEVQVEKHHGLGFTVKYKGYRVRFDYSDELSSAAVIVYMGRLQETPIGRQATLLEAC